MGSACWLSCSAPIIVAPLTIASSAQAFVLIAPDFAKPDPYVGRSAADSFSYDLMADSTSPAIDRKSDQHQLLIANRSDVLVAPLTNSRLGTNKQHLLVPLLRQSSYSRLAGYEDVNDAERLCAEGRAAREVRDVPVGQGSGSTTLVRCDPRPDRTLGNPAAQGRCVTLLTSSAAVNRDFKGGSRRLRIQVPSTGRELPPAYQGAKKMPNNHDVLDTGGGRSGYKRRRSMPGAVPGWSKWEIPAQRLAVVATCRWLAVLGVCIVALPAAADNWKNPASGNWGLGSNWVDGTAPAANDSAVFAVPGAYTVAFVGDSAPIQSLSLSNSTSPIFVSDSPFTPSTLFVTSASGSRDVDVYSATLTLGSAGILGSIGKPLHMTVGQQITVGADGTLNVRAGSHVVAPYVEIDPGGRLNLTGGGSSLSSSVAIFVASVSGGAALSIAGGANVSSQFGSMGSFAGKPGEATVSGASTSWNNAQAMTVGWFAPGTLNIDNHASVTSQRIYLGEYNGVSGTVSLTARRLSP